MRLTSLTLAVLITSAAAVPFHGHAHDPQRVRRDANVVTAYVVETDTTVLYVDQSGNPVATSTESVDASATTFPSVGAADFRPPQGAQSAPGGSEDFDTPQPLPTPSPLDSSSEAPPPPSSQTTQASPSSDLAPAASPASDAAGQDGELAGYSIAYAPYRSDGNCKSATDVDADIDGLSGYDMVRIYGTDCDQVRLVMNAAKRNNLKVFAGIWDIHNVATEASIIVDAARSDWSVIHTVSVGNELLNTTAPSEIVNAIGIARSILVESGYTGKVTTVDIWFTLGKVLESPSNGLCQAIDYIAANCHPFFDGEVAADEAAQWVYDKTKDLGGITCDKEVVITESGWPSEGPTFGKAVPSPQNQRTVIDGLRSVYAGEKQKLVLFSAYNEPWKPDNGFGVESFWGILGNAPSAR